MSLSVTLVGVAGLILASPWAPERSEASSRIGAVSESCGRPGYSYAGFQSASTAHGVAATVTPLSVPDVRSGHTAAWVGVGGPGAANGRDAWIQVGLASFPEAGIRLYFEITQPATGSRYQEVASRVRPGSSQRIAVLELTRRPNWWRVWVNGRAVSAPAFLPASSGRWRPIATAESWDGGTRTCNRFEYRFGHVAVAAARGGSWRRFVRGVRFQDPGYRVVPLRSRSSFLATAATPPPR